MQVAGAVAEWLKVVAFEAMKLCNWEVQGSIPDQVTVGLVLPYELTF